MSTYNGWSNYETWLVFTHLSNTEETWTPLVRIAKSVAQQQVDGDDDTQQPAEDRLYYAIHQHLESIAELVDINVHSLGFDLLNSAIQEVNVWEIVRSMIRDEVDQLKGAA